MLKAVIINDNDNIRWIESVKTKTSYACALTLCLLVGGCIHTNEMALAPNVVRLDTQASGLLFTGSAGDQTQRRAAELTLQHGYTHYRLEQAEMGQGERFAGLQTFGNGNATAQGNSASYSGTSISTPIYKPTANVGVTVVMFRANEPGAQGAFDATEVLKQYRS
jgi:hypothetical protein